MSSLFISKYVSYLLANCFNHRKSFKLKKFRFETKWYRQYIDKLPCLYLCVAERGIQLSKFIRDDKNKAFTFLRMCASNIPGAYEHEL